ncbi:MAG: hypothetical protein ACYDHP_12205 [Ferrimicrobium sp.]
MSCKTLRSGGLLVRRIGFFFRFPQILVGLPVEWARLARSLDWGPAEFGHMVVDDAVVG